MRKIQQHVMTLTAAILLLGISVVAEAKTRVTVAATVRTPNVAIRIGHTTSSPYRRHAGFPITKHRHFKVTQRDRKIARRLSRYAGVPAYAMLRFKHSGYTWRQIGRFYHLPRLVVRASMTGKRWHRFLENERCLAGNGRRPNRRGYRQVAILDY